MKYDDLIARLRDAEAGTHYPLEDLRALLEDAADALERPTITDDMVERAAEAYTAHSQMHVPIEAHEISCRECGWAFTWRASASDEYDARQWLERQSSHAIRKALTAALEGDE